MQVTRSRIGAATLIVMAALAGSAFGASTHAQPPPASALDSFGGTTMALVIPLDVKPLYHERTVKTRYRLHRVPCAGLVASTDSCYAASPATQRPKRS